MLFFKVGTVSIFCFLIFLLDFNLHSVIWVIFQSWVSLNWLIFGVSSSLKYFSTTSIQKFIHFEYIWYHEVLFKLHLMFPFHCLSYFWYIHHFEIFFWVSTQYSKLIWVYLTSLNIFMWHQISIINFCLMVTLIILPVALTIWKTLHVVRYKKLK